MPAEAVAASQQAEAEPFQTDRVVTISAGHAVHDTYTAFLPPLLPAFIESMSLSKAEAGLLTAFQQAPSLLQPFIGFVADRVSLRYLVILTPAVSATAMSLLGIAPSYAVLALMLMVAGLSSATLHAVAPVIAGRLSGTRLGRGMGFWMVGGELGRTLGPLAIAAYFVFWPDDLSHTPWLMIGGWLTSLLLFVRLRNVEGRPPRSEQGVPWRQVLRIMAPLLIPLTGIILVRSFMSSALTTYLPTFLAEEGAELWLAGISLSVLEAAGVVGALLGGSLSDRFGRRVVLFISLLVTPLLMLPPPVGHRLDCTLCYACHHGPGPGKVSREPGVGQRHLHVVEFRDPFGCGGDRGRHGRLVGYASLFHGLCFHHTARLAILAAAAQAAALSLALPV
jgi:FSR family fosmidomycin resistance protein-like MFS transporter